MGFRLRFLCPPPWSVVLLGLTGRVWGGMPWGGGYHGGGGGRLRATRAHIDHFGGVSNLERSGPFFATIKAFHIFVCLLIWRSLSWPRA